MKKIELIRANIYKKKELTRNGSSLALWQKLKVEDFASSLAKKGNRQAIVASCRQASPGAEHGVGEVWIDDEDLLTSTIRRLCIGDREVFQITRVWIG